MSKFEVRGGSSAAAEGAASTDSSLLLVDCLHSSVFRSSVSSGPADVQRCFRVLLRLLSNHRQYPTNASYASFSSVSAAWQAGVLPCVYVLRLVAWMGCTPNTEGSRYVFPSLSSAGQLGELDDRMEELRCVMAVWSTPVGLLCGPFDSATTVSGGIDDLSLTTTIAGQNNAKSLGEAREALIELYRNALRCTFMLHDDSFRLCTRALQLQLLLVASRVLEKKTTAVANSAEAPAAAAATPLPPLTSWLLRVHAEVERSDFCVSNNSSIQWLLENASLCELSQECEQAAAAAASAATHVSDAVFYRWPLPFGTHPSSAASAALAQRFRQQALAEQHQCYINSTGPAYRRLSHEERHRGESAVIDIAGLLEQLAVVTETQRLVRADRQEARRLLDEFKQDGDLVKLYTLQEQYTAELEEAKAKYGKPLVFAEYE